MSIGVPEEATTRMNTPSAEHARILVVDEDPAFQLGLKTFLREYVGFEKVFTAQSGAEAVARILEDETIDVVTLDFQMPGMTGIEVLEELKGKLDRPVSFLMITGYPSEELENEFMSFRSETLLPTHFLTKPVEFDKIEPLVLQSHEEVCAAREIGLTEIEEDHEDSEVEASVSPNRELRKLREQIVIQADRISELENQVTTQRKSWRFDILKGFLLVGLLFSAWHFGWLEKAKPIGKKIMEDVRVFLPEGNATSASPPGSTGIAPDTQDPLPPSSVNEGRPL